MNSLEATPYNATSILALTDDERMMLELALNYTLRQVLADHERCRYYLPLGPASGESRIPLYPDELLVLEGIAGRVIGNPEQEGEA